MKEKIKKTITLLRKESIPLQEFILLRWHFIVYITAIAVIYDDLQFISRKTYFPSFPSHTYLKNLKNELTEQLEQFYTLKNLWRQLNEDVDFKAYKPRISRLNIVRDEFIDTCKLKGVPNPNEVLCVDLWWDYHLTYAQVFQGLQQLIFYMVLFIILLELDYYLHKNANRYYCLSNVFLCIILIAMLFYHSLSVEFIICQKIYLAVVLPENAMLLEQLNGWVSEQKQQHDTFRE